MRAVVQSGYGSPAGLELVDLPTPVPGPDEVLVRVRAASVHPDVWHVVTGTPYVLRLMGSGVRRPRNPVPGTDLAGQVEAVGEAVTRFRPGDPVFGETIRGMQWVNGGAYAEFATVPESGLALRPDITFEQAATVPTAGLIALHNLVGHHDPARPTGAGERRRGRRGRDRRPARRAYGAHVTGVDTGDKRDLVLGLGAHRFVDFTREDFTRAPERYDLVFDVPGNHSFAECRRVLTPTAPTS